MPRPFPGRTATTSVCLAMVLAATAACSGGAPDGPGDAAGDRPSASASLTSAPEVTTDVRMGQVFGHLPARERRAVRRQVGTVVDDWWEASYLGGDFPRSRFPSSFPGFTKGAEARARSDKHLMSNRGIGERVDSVVASKRRVILDVVSVDRRARSVTARFVLRFETTGEESGTTVVRGRLFLTRRGGEWRVFGYDVARGVLA